MGSSLSPLLAETFTSILGQSLETYTLFYKIIFFRRYVDDIICIFDGDFLNFLNNLHGAISFIMRIISSNKFPFLDILLYRMVDHIESSIFHKSTSAD